MYLSMKLRSKYSLCVTVSLKFDSLYKVQALPGISVVGLYVLPL